MIHGLEEKGVSKQQMQVKSLGYSFVFIFMLLRFMRAFKVCVVYSVHPCAGSIKIIFCVSLFYLNFFYVCCFQPPTTFCGRACFSFLCFLKIFIFILVLLLLLNFIL